MPAPRARQIAAIWASGAESGRPADRALRHEFAVVPRALGRIIQYAALEAALQKLLEAGLEIDFAASLVQAFQTEVNFADRNACDEQLHGRLSIDPAHDFR